jgi:hypothetical protein
VFGLGTAFHGHLQTRNYNYLQCYGDSQTLQFTTARTKPSQSAVFTDRRLVTALNAVIPQIPCSHPYWPATALPFNSSSICSHMLLFRVTADYASLPCLPATGYHTLLQASTHFTSNSERTAKKTPLPTVPLLSRAYPLLRSRDLVTVETCLQIHCLGSAVSSGYTILAFRERVAILTHIHLIMQL